MTSFILYVAAAAAVIYLGNRFSPRHARRARRRAAFEALAMADGWTYSADGAELGLPAVGEIHVLPQGDGSVRSCFLVADRPCGRVTVFDYEYVDPNRSQSRLRHQTVCHLNRPGMALPRFALTPELVLNRLVGTKDIDFPDHPKFSKIYFLQGEDEDAVRALFRPELLSFLETRPDWSIRGAGDELAVHRWDGRAYASDVAPYVANAEEILEAFAQIPPI